MGPDGMKLRMDDLKEWPSLTLQRRMQLDLDMELALIGVGSGGGLNHFILRWDRSVIEEILKKRITVEQGKISDVFIGD